MSKLKEPYIAISHVWSDGIGLGGKAQGSVSRCLFNRFAYIAETLQCDAVWWDALSIPSETKARNKAISQTHKNYANVERTVVHNQYLLSLEWTDRGTACLALVLFPWFTRGCTCLEPAMSRNIKMLFKGPDPGTPDIRDLD